MRRTYAKLPITKYMSTVIHTHSGLCATLFRIVTLVFLGKILHFLYRWKHYRGDIKFTTFAQLCLQLRQCYPQYETTVVCYFRRSHLIFIFYQPSDIKCFRFPKVLENNILSSNLIISFTVISLLSCTK